MMPLTVDPAVLAREATNLERIGTELRAVFNQVQAIAIELLPQFRGTAGIAVQAALARFQQAAVALMAQHDELMNGVRAAGIRYSATDEERGRSLAAEMHVNDDESSKDHHGKVELADHHTFKDAPGAPFPADGKPWQYNIDLTSPIYMDAVPSVEDVWNELHRCFTAISQSAARRWGSRKWAISCRLK